MQTLGQVGHVIWDKFMFLAPHWRTRQQASSPLRSRALPSMITEAAKIISIQILRIRKPNCDACINVVV
ncbi:hypothetical protein L5515_016726 [Caenorhabditis briggsae]|uniref:Uncharacterized protein n=1 Tax=Caenorhabditis briggsae TaxID=6238 RepID=A0AAE9FCY5_CAEBR|nr:hypothetical protein L5515_016726 [Caenorhabditis briggsae]